MEHALILLAVLDFSYLVFANQGEPGSFSWHTGLHSAAAPTSNKIVNPVGSTEMKLHVLPTLSGTANLLHTALSLKSEPVRTSDRNDNSVKSTEMMMTAAVLDFSGTTASESPTSSLKLEAVTTSFAPGAVKESLTTDHERGSLTAIQTPKLSDLQASTIDLVRGSILVSKGISSHSVMQSANAMQSQVGPASLTHLDTPTQVEQPSIISTSQSIVSQVMPSAQVSQFTSTVKIKSSSLYLSASQSLEVVDMTTKTPLSLSTHATALLSTGSIATLSTPPSVNSSGLASYGSSLLMSSSVSVPEFNTSRSQEGIHPTTTYLPTIQSSLLLSSSAFMPPTTAPPPGNPAPPVILDATALSATSILLQWNASNAQFIANFSVDFSTDSISWNHASCQQSLVEGACTVNQTEARVTLLKPYTNYTFRVAAQGAFGKTNYSIESTWILTSEAVPSQPAAVKAIAVNSTAIFVNWTEPAEVNGVIIKYEVRYAMINSTQSADAVIRSVQDTMNVVLSSLNPLTFYEISVSAFTSKGKGNRTTVQEQTDEGQPSAPQNISAKSLNSTAILVSWEKPADPNGKIKYRLSLRKKSNPVATFVVAYDGGSTQYLVSNLKPFTQYSFKVNAYNVKYNLSSSSIVAMETTAEAAPSGPPQNLYAITNSSSSIILYWMPPKAAEQNGQITNYNIHINSALEQARRINTSATTFVVTGLQAYTNYSFMVQAVTVGGTGPYSGVVANITFEAEPSAPRNVTAKSANSTAIKVTWVEALHPNGVILYKLYMRSSQDDESTNQLPVYEGLGTTYVATGLQEYVMYTFTVVSFNVKYNWTSQQIVAKETTHPAEPAGPPQNVAVVPLSSSSIEVTWSPPLLSEQNGVIIHYTVKYSSMSGQSGSVNTSDNSTVIKHLSFFTSYSFTVKAWNVMGSGPDSEPINITTLEDRPSPPTNVGTQTMNATAIRVTWQEPLHPNGEIAYRLFFWQSSEGFETRKLAYDGLLLESTVAGLHEYVTYTFMVLAYNVEHSWSSEAVNVSETTHPAAPAGSPQDVMALTQSSTSILIKWRPPLELDRNGIITRYIVKYNVSSGKEANNSTSDNTTRILVTNLKKYSSYYFTVQAENNIGVGPPSEVVVNTTFEDVPGAPVIEGVNNTKPDSLEVMWKPPAETNGVIKAYRLCWSLANLQNRTCVKLNGARRSHEIPKLKPYTEYRISLNASTSVGVGPAATYVSRTAEGEPKDPPRNIVIKGATSVAITLSWDPPLEPNGIIEGYYVMYYDRDQPNKKNINNVKGRVHTIPDLEPFRYYRILVACQSSGGLGPYSEWVEQRTNPGEPKDPPRNIVINGTTSVSITLSWVPPPEPNGIIEGYDVMYYDRDQPNMKNINENVKGRVHTILDLEPFRHYRIRVACQSSGGLGPYSEWVEQRTDPGAPPPLGTLPAPKSIQSSTFSIVLTEASNENWIVSFYQVIVIELATDNNNEPVPAQDPESYKPEDLYTYDQARKMRPQLVPYIAAQFSASEFDRYKYFVVGDGRRTSSDAIGVTSRRRRRETNSGTGFVNGPLEENTYYAVFQRAYLNKDVYTSSSWITLVATDVKGTAPTERKIFEWYYIAGPLSAVIIIVVIFVIWYICKRRMTVYKAKAANLDEEQGYELEEMDHEVDKWEVSRDRIVLREVIGSGAFGVVWKGSLKEPGRGHRRQVIAAKCFTPTSGAEGRRALMREIELGKQLEENSQPNIVTFIGCVTTRIHPILIMEYLPCGDLLGYLRKSRGIEDKYHRGEGEAVELETYDLVSFARQIANGMIFLGSRGIIHRDLAARNVLLDRNCVCKITDFGLAYRNFKYGHGNAKKGRIPVKWTAPEILYGNPAALSSQSDVWSYGIVLYEIFTIGGIPYPGWTEGKTIAEIKSGYRMPKPPHIDDTLYSVMTRCWHEIPEFRLPFVQLRKRMTQYIEEELYTGLVDMSKYNGAKYSKVEDEGAEAGVYDNPATDKPKKKQSAKRKWKSVRVETGAKPKKNPLAKRKWQSVRVEVGAKDEPLMYESKKKWSAERKWQSVRAEAGAKDEPVMDEPKKKWSAERKGHSAREEAGATEEEPVMDKTKKKPLAERKWHSLGAEAGAKDEPVMDEPKKKPFAERKWHSVRAEAGAKDEPVMDEPKKKWSAERKWESVRGAAGAKDEPLMYGSKKKRSAERKWKSVRAEAGAKGSSYG